MVLGRGDLPHDLLQLLVEGTVGIRGTFTSTGRKRTKPGRAVIARNRDGIDRAEHVADEHLRRWAFSERSKALGVPSAEHL